MYVVSYNMSIVVCTYFPYTIIKNEIRNDNNRNKNKLRKNKINK